MDADTIGRLVREIHGPLNVLGARGGSTSALAIPALEKLGVRRVSIGGSLSVAALGFAQQAMRELREHGSFGYAPAAPSNASINAVMARYRE